MNLGIVSCVFNPARLTGLKLNYYQFLNALGPHRERLLTTVLVYDHNTEYVPTSAETVLLYGTLEEHVLWQKERLLSAAIDLLPSRYDAVAWLDADVMFDDPGWVEDAEKALEEYPVVQLFEIAHYYDRQGVLDVRRPSILRGSLRGFKRPAWGLAWAARREVVKDGLLDRIITGGGDAFMVDAWRGNQGGRPRYDFLPSFNKYYMDWADRQTKLTLGKVTHLKHDIKHLYHGDLDKRKYGWRLNVMSAHQYDPMKDVELDGNLLRWTGNNPGLRQVVEEWLTKGIYDRA